MNIRHGWRFYLSTSFLFLVLALIFGSSATLASEFCSRSNPDLIAKFKAPENRIAFQNDGGLGDGGVCWWHSRLQRSSIYLTQYAPSKPQPTIAEARELVRKLVFFSNVVEIPGYANFADFSHDFEPVVQKELNNWQIRDGFINQQWIRGLHGHPSLPAATLTEHMNALYQKFLHTQPGLWVMVQLPGIASHALLVIGMDQLETGYTMHVIDSNYPSITRDLDYHFGDQTIHLDSEIFTPYPGFESDLTKINKVVQNYCKQ